MRCARFSNQTKVLARFCAALHCRLCAQPLDAERGLAFRIPDTRRAPPIGSYYGAPPAIERRARPMLQRFALPSPRPLSFFTHLGPPGGCGMPLRDSPTTD